MTAMLLLVKCYGNKMVKSPYNCVIYLLTQPQVANRQKNYINIGLIYCTLITFNFLDHPEWSR